MFLLLLLLWRFCSPHDGCNFNFYSCSTNCVRFPVYLALIERIFLYYLRTIGEIWLEPSGEPAPSRTEARERQDTSARQLASRDTTGGGAHQRSAATQWAARVCRCRCPRRALTSLSAHLALLFTIEII